MKRSITALFAGAAVLASTSGAAFATSDTTATFSNPSAGRPNVVDLTGGGTPSDPAGSYVFSIEETDVLAFCIEASKDLPAPSEGVVYSVDVASEGFAEMAAIASAHEGIGTPLGDENDEAAAAQLAIWTFSDGLVLDEGHVPDAALRARAQELVDGASAATLPAFTGGALTGAATNDGTSAVVTATLVDQAGNPLVGEEVVFTPAVGDAQTGVTGTDGKVVVTFPSAGVMPIDLLWTGLVPAGAILTPADGSQALITAAPFTVTRATAVDVAPTVPTTTTTPPTTVAPTTVAPTTVAPTTVAPTTVAPTTTVVTTGTLPDTGSGLGWVFALLGGGVIAGLVFMVRRSREWA